MRGVGALFMLNQPCLRSLAGKAVRLAELVLLHILPVLLFYQAPIIRKTKCAIYENEMYIKTQIGRAHV